MKKILSLLLALSASLAAFADKTDGCDVHDISAKVKSYPLDSINLSTPLDYYLSRAWVRSTGQRKYWPAISTSKFTFDENAPDEEIDESFRSYILSENIDFIVTFRDSVAAIVTHFDGEEHKLINLCWIEDGRWVNGGQSLADDFDDAREKAMTQLQDAYANLPRIAIINSMPEDVTPFTDYLKGVSSSPEQFVLDMLASHRLVINGEYHRRKVSWDMLKRLIALPAFAEKVGHIFMELPSWCQPLMDRFMASDSLDSELLLQIFREEQPNGWWDRGEFEFICQLWQLNQTLPDEMKIKPVMADYQIPYSKITSADQREVEDRNTHMADVITQTIRSSCDKRSNLFLVGCGHAYKSNQAGLASAAHGKEPEKTAAAQLIDRLGAENVFTIFQHVLPGDNLGRNKQPIRGGMFDKAFAIAGNRPVGFRLADSPFGKEPFDGIYELKYKLATGTYADNFDGYLFLHPLENEPAASPLTEIFTDEFVAEIQRRASAMGMENYRWLWFGKPAPEISRDYIITVLTSE